MALTDEQQKNFEAIATKLGFTPGEHTPNMVMENIKKSVSNITTLSSDPAHTTEPHRIIPLGSVDELKKIVGASDDASDDHITYPEPSGIDPTTAKKNLDNNQIHHLKKLTHSYVFGNSSKISKDDVALINNALFPTKVAAYSYPDYTVQSGETLQIKSGTVANYGTLTVDKGGQIVVLGDGTMTCQKFIQNS